MAREVTNSPGTCCITVGRTDCSWLAVSLSRPMTVTVMGRCLVSVTLRVPVTTTSERLAVPAGSAAAARRVPPL